MRRGFQLRLVLLSLLMTVFFCAVFLLNGQDIKLQTTVHTTEASYSLAPLKHATKSLAELGKMDEVNRHFLLLNHVPKCGSEILILLLQKLQGLNSYKHVRLTGGNRRHLTKSEQETLVEEIYNIIREEAVPLSFDRHVYFINFTVFEKQLPTYINFIRNPVERIISRTSFRDNKKESNDYYKCLIRKKNNCNFKNGRPYDLSIPYFCGHDQRCMILNDEWAFQTAKNNVVSYFPVVGVLEELNATLEILESKIPFFFKGAKKIYEKDLLHFHKGNKRPKVPNVVRRKLRESLVKELEFYEWIKGRLFKQLQILYAEQDTR